MPGPVRWIAVVVGAARTSDAERGGHRDVPRRGRRVVVAVVRLDRVEPIGHKPGNPLVVSHEPGVRKRRQTASLMNVADDVRRRSAGTRHERRPALREPAVERLVCRRDVARGNQRTRDPRPPGGLRRILQSGAQERLGVERYPVFGKPRHRLTEAIDALPPLPGEKGAKRR